MLPLLCLTALVLPQTSVSITLPATRPAAIAKALSEQTGKKIEVDRSVPELPLVVSVKAVPLETLLAKIALATGAEVVREEDTYRLTRTPKRLAELRENERAMLEASWTQALAERRKILEKEPWDAQSAKKWYEREQRRIQDSEEVAGVKYGLDVLKPTARLMFRLLELIGPKELSSHRGPFNVVYSRYPTAMQRAFPKPIDSLLARFDRETKANPIRGEDGVWVGFSELHGPVSKLHLVIKTELPEASARLTVYDQQGRLGEEALFRVGRGPIEDIDTPETRFADLKPFALSKLAATELLFAPDASRRFKGELPAELVNRWLNPESSDPVLLAASEVMIEAASQKGLNLVAAVPDWPRTYELGASDDTTDPRRFLKALSMSTHDLRLSNGWLIGVPRWPLVEESVCMPRPVMGAFIRRVDRSGSGLDAEAAFASGLSVTLAQDRTCLVIFPANQYLEEKEPNALWSNARSTLLLQRFIGRLTPTHRSQLSLGETLLASNLQPNELSPLVEATYISPEWSIPPEEGYLQEVTEALPNGVPPDTRITLQSRTSPIFLNSTVVFSARAYGLAKLAFERRVFETVEGGEPFVRAFLPKEITPATEQIHTLEIDYGRGIKQIAEFKYQRPRGKAIDPLSLPEVRAAVDAAKKEFASKTNKDILSALWSIDR